MHVEVLPKFLKYGIANVLKVFAEKILLKLAVLDTWAR